MIVRDLASPRTLVSANSIISDISGRVPTSSLFSNAMASRNERFCRSKVRYAERIERIWLVAKPFLSKPTLLIPPHYRWAVRANVAAVADHSARFDYRRGMNNDRHDAPNKTRQLDPVAQDHAYRYADQRPHEIVICLCVTSQMTVDVRRVCRVAYNQLAVAGTNLLGRDHRVTDGS